MVDVIVRCGGYAGVIAALRTRELGESKALGKRDRLNGTGVIDLRAPITTLARTTTMVRGLRLIPLSPIWRELCRVPLVVAKWQIHVI